ncbi:MAG: hypothetical protein IT578_11745 [Verrucomicrobiae bacterium]|nr:hypothetical protein [Verrucomicrobiae bacterium]
MFRWLFRWILLTVLLVGGLALTRNWIARHLLISELERTTRLPCSVEAMNVHLSSPVIEARAVSLYNPPYSSRTPLALEIRAITARYDLGALLRGRWVFSKLDVEIAVANVVRSPEGPTNLRGLQQRLDAGGGRNASFVASEFSIRAEKICYVDESRGRPRIQTASHGEVQTWRDLRGEGAVRKCAAAFLARLQANDPFEAPLPPLPKPASPSSKGKPPRKS